MADNSPQNGTDSIRDIDRSGSGPKTQVMQLDHGGTGATESLTSRTNPLPTYNAFEDRATFRGKASTFRTPGRAGTTGAKLLTLHNATGSTKIVHINSLFVDLVATVIKAVTVLPPQIKVWRFTALPTNGSVLTKAKKDSALTSDTHVVVSGDASADGTLSATALAFTPTELLAQEFAPRLITAAGYEMFDRTTLVDGDDIVLRALEGIGIELAYTATAQNPATDMWVAGIDWFEV